MDLFAALDYTGLENRTSALLLSVLHHLTDESRDAFLRGVISSSFGFKPEICAQYGISMGVLDGWLCWSGRCVVVLEAKVDDDLGPEQPERYARWLAEQDVPQRVLWLVTRERPEVKELLRTMTRPEGVTIVQHTWTELAHRASEIASNAPEVDQFLLNALSRRLRASGVAEDALQPLNEATLGPALRFLPYIKAFRQHLVAWFGGLSWLPGEWKREARYTSWKDLSVYAERWLKLNKKDKEDKARWVSWWLEVYAPEQGPEIWPPGQQVGVLLRVGVRLQGSAASEIALEPIRAALGAPSAANHPDFRASPGPRVTTFDSGAYHEVWWILTFNPMDLKGSEAHLRVAMAEQSCRLAPLVEGGLASIEVKDIKHSANRNHQAETGMKEQHSAQAANFLLEKKQI